MLTCDDDASAFCISNARQRVIRAGPTFPYHLVRVSQTTRRKRPSLNIIESTASMNEGHPYESASDFEFRKDLLQERFRVCVCDICLFEKAENGSRRRFIQDPNRLFLFREKKTAFHKKTTRVPMILRKYCTYMAFMLLLGRCQRCIQTIDSAFGISHK